MQDNPLVSIIIPVYNVELYVKECIESVLKQTYKNIEIIIVDDGSTDNSLKVCKEVLDTDKRIKVIHQENQGVVKARNKGIELANGDYIMFVDSDDWIDANMLEELVKNMVDVDIVTSGMYHEIEKGKVLEKYDQFTEGVNNIEIILKTMIYDRDNNCVQPLLPTMCGKLYKREIAKEIYSAVEPTITFTEDSIFLYKYLLKCKRVKILKTSYYYYRWRKDSCVHSVDYNRLTIINKIYVSLKKDFEEHKLSKVLISQLEIWIKIATYKSINEDMGLENSQSLPHFIINTKGLDNKKIVLYGAGLVGKDAYNQLIKFGYEVVLWVDKDWERYRTLGLNVFNINEILKSNYDVIFIAVKEENIYLNIKKDLINLGIAEEKLLWNKHIYLY